MENTQLPIEHISYSSAKLLCSNPFAFRQQYILNIRKYKERPSGIAGKALHKTLEMLEKGSTLDKATEAGLQYIDEKDDKDINYGKNGSRADILNTFTKGLNFYMQERPDFGEVLACEKKITAAFEYEGIRVPLPIKSVSDVISRKEGRLCIWDYKLTDKQTEPTEERPDYIMQAMWNYYCVKEKYQETPYMMCFIEIKPSLNSGANKGQPQVNLYPVVFSEHPQYFKYFNRLYMACLEFLANQNQVFLPNFADIFTGEDVWSEWGAEALDFNMPKMVVHKSVLAEAVTEVNYVESLTDKYAADTLSEEEMIIAKFKEFGIPLAHVETHKSANVTLYTYKASRGVKMSKIKDYRNDVQSALECKSLRIDAPIPGTNLIGFEVSNEVQDVLPFDESLLEKSTLMLPIGVDVYNKQYKLDLAKAPHLLVAGTTGSGKSVGLNVFINALVAQNTPEELGLVLIDPKRTEFAFFFENDPHLLCDIASEVADIESVLNIMVEEMENRYKQLRDMKCRNIDDFNKTGHMQKVVIVIDELADIVLSPQIKVTRKFVGRKRDGSPKYEEKKEKYSDLIQNNIIRLAQKARAVGIHVIAATQRPSVDVVTGILKANFPTRIAFMTSSAVDSQVILDEMGAEQLIGNGDLLLKDPRQKGLIRLQGYYL